jgi:hypothetical protein
MTARSAILLALAIAMAAAAPARAERLRPGDRAKIRLTHERPRVGWVARSGIEAQHDRTRRSGFSGKHREDAVKVKIEIDRVRGFDDPRTKTTCTIELAKGDEVIVIGRGHEGWILVETAAGDIGWIPASVVADAGRFAGDPRREPGAAAAAVAAAAAATADADAEMAGPSPERGRTAAAAAAAAAAPPARLDAHLVATAGAETFALRQADAMAIASGPLGAVAASARVHVASQAWLGVAGNAAFSSGELTYYDTTAQSQPMATRDTVIDASAEVGWGRAWSIAARGGYHHAALEVESERTEPMLVGERVRGATVGLGGTAPIGRRFAVAAAIDVMPAGAHAPADAGVAAAASVRGAWARGTVTARVTGHLLAALAYRGGALDFAMADGTKRSDQSHAVTAGLGVTW